MGHENMAPAVRLHIQLHTVTLRFYSQYQLKKRLKPGGVRGRMEAMLDLAG